MESGIVTSYKNKGIIIPELISLPFFLRFSNICLKNYFYIYNKHISESELQTRQTRCQGYPFQVYKTNKIHMVIYEPFNATILII